MASHGSDLGVVVGQEPRPDGKHLVEAGHKVGGNAGVVGGMNSGAVGVSGGLCPCAGREAVYRPQVGASDATELGWARHGAVEL